MPHAEHRRMVEAIEDGDADLGVELMRAHLRGVKSYWVGLIDRNLAQPSAVGDAEQTTEPTPGGSTRTAGEDQPDA